MECFLYLKNETNFYLAIYSWKYDFAETSTDYRVYNSIILCNSIFIGTITHVSILLIPNLLPTKWQWIRILCSENNVSNS